MSEDSPSAPPDAQRQPTGNCRPERVERLLVEGETHDHWFTANRKANRFFVVNLQHVIAQITLEHTTAGKYFDKAEETIRDRTKWRDQYRFEYASSHVQIYPRNVREKKFFGHAATIIVALELAAADKRPDFNVYDYLRILPSQYFVDRFDAAMYKRMVDSFNGMRVEDRMEKFGSEGPFDAIALKAIDQEISANLLNEMSFGFCVTKYTAKKFAEFAAKFFPELAIGPVRSAGEESVSDVLGSKISAPSLRVKRTWGLAELPPCF